MSRRLYDYIDEDINFIDEDEEEEYVEEVPKDTVDLTHLDRLRICPRCH